MAPRDPAGQRQQRSAAEPRPLRQRECLFRRSNGGGLSSISKKARMRSNGPGYHAARSPPMPRGFSSMPSPTIWATSCGHWRCPDGAAMVADQPAREADQDRCEDRQPWALCHVSAGRGCGTAADVRRHSVADCPPASTARAGMRDQCRQTLQAATAEMRLEPAKSARFSGSVPSDGRLAASIPTVGTIYDCPIPPKGRSWPPNRQESGECRL